MNPLFSIKDACEVATFSFTQSISYYIWTIITTLWPWYWLLIVIVLGLWVTFEIYTRHGIAHYNSDNGFSPTFNRFVGSGTYLGLQTVLYFLFSFIFSDAIYCYIWPFAIHIVIFLSTGLLLHLSGFWPTLKRPKLRKRKGKY